MEGAEKCKNNLKSGVTLFLQAQGKLNCPRVLRALNGAIAAANGESKRFRQGYVLTTTLSTGYTVSPCGPVLAPLSVTQLYALRESGFLSLRERNVA